MDIKNIIANKTGKTVVAMPDMTDTWLQWYKGNVAKFHSYDTYNGRKKVECHRKTLNMAKKVSEDWANLLLNEKTDISYGDEEQQKELWALLNKVRFWQKGNEGIEKSFALGNGALVETVDDLGKERLQFVDATKIYPLTFDQDKIIECAFVNSNSKTTVIQAHLIDEDTKNYIIRTIRYEKGQNTTQEDIGQEVSDEVFETNSTIPWFQFIRPNIANNVDLNSPMGISVYANAVDSLSGVDLAYDGFCEEMRLGKCRIFVNSKLISYIDGEEKPVFDNNDVGFYWYGNGEDNDNKRPLEFYNPTLRTDGYFNGINNSLNLLSSKCGFGENHYRFDTNGISTATQVISENSEMFRTLKKHEILLNDVIIDACKALMYIHNEFALDDGYKFNLDENIEVQFDDSIIEDKSTEMLNDRQDVNMGVMSLVEYRMKWYAEDETTAKQKVMGIQQEKRANMSNFFSEE